MRNHLISPLRFLILKDYNKNLLEKTTNQISFAVVDKGQGIDEAYIKRIFERYFKIPGRSDKKGSGIGVAICKELIEAMNGKIWVKGEIGVDSTFGFSFNLSI